MKMVFKWILSSVLLMFVGNLYATDYAPSSVKMDLKQVSKHVWYVQGAAGIATDNEGFISNAGVVITDEGVVVFDALGTPSLGHKLLQEIRKLTDKPVKRVIVSHYHADHIYGLQVFKEAGAEIYAPTGANKYLTSPESVERLDERRFSLSPWVNENTKLIWPDHNLVKGFSFTLGGVKMTVSVVGAAHSDGDLTLYVENDRVLFSGDIIFEGRVAYLGDADTKHWLKTLQQMETGGLAVLIPGHGSVADNPNQSITQTRRYLAFLRKKMKVGVDDLLTFHDTYAATDWSEFKNLPAFKEANRKNAYQVFLSLEREALTGE